MAMRRRSLSWLPAIILLQVLVLGGCYHYTVVDMHEVMPSQDIRARVSLGEAERLDELIPRRHPRIVEGRVSAIHQGTLFLDVALESSPRGTRAERFAQRLDIPFTSIEQLENRELSRARTAALVVGTTAALAFIVVELILDSGGGIIGPPSNGGLEDSSPRTAPRIRFSLPISY